MFYFIVNEHGGSGTVRRNWHKLYVVLKQQGVSFRAFKTDGPGDANRLATKISAIPTEKDDDKKIIVVGGDGTINEVINGISDFDAIKVGVIPLGSANDFAKGLGLLFDPLEALIKLLMRPEEKQVDLGEVTLEDGTKKLFAISAGIGFDAYVCSRLDKSVVKKLFNRLHIGNASYVFETVMTLLTMHSIRARVSLDDAPEQVMDQLIFLAAMNTPYEGGGVKMAPNADACDGLLNMVCGHDRTRLEAPASLLKVLMKKHEEADEFILQPFKTMKIESETPLIYHTDGEADAGVMSLSISCQPNKLTLIM